MQYKVLLIGGKELFISDDEGKKLMQAIKEDEKGFLQVDKQLIQASAIKAVIELKEPVVGKVDRSQEWKDWHRECLSMSKLTVEEKTEKEIKIRIMPGWKMSKQKEDDPLLSETYGAIANFFEENPMYPRCPMRIWYPILGHKISKKEHLSKWFSVVSQNDRAIEDWVNYQKSYENSS